MSMVNDAAFRLHRFEVRHGERLTKDLTRPRPPRPPPPEDQGGVRKDHGQAELCLGSRGQPLRAWQYLRGRRRGEGVNE